MNSIKISKINVKLIFSISTPFLVGNQPEGYTMIVGCSVSKRAVFYPVATMLPYYYIFVYFNVLVLRVDKDLNMVNNEHVGASPKKIPLP